ncbi:Putative amino acid permease [Candidatus Trichorickettsia mobilis]|uniref:Amino acid permease n=1 Tax=Candidatus Trichorickettsia mobilis TaxID=1346319 RepID=A0ABZ0UUZ6_9RICK|nr:amino acid permease [Candidatus Trichorickettsia mobilis]WPY00897.1 Putative amino acid permease [Candidatus Trichorickettsia mobilis]
MNFFKQKSFESVKEIANIGGLNKNLGAFDLILFGLGGIIGTGVFVLTGLVAAKYSGPAVMLSYIIAGGTCIFVALAYTELATMLPTSGSVYTYSYVAFGEIIAWLMGSIMILELCFMAAAVSAGWSGYVQSILKTAGFTIPSMLVKVPADGGIMNLPAFCIIAIVGLILYFGNKDSVKINAILVFIKMGAIFTFVFSATPHFKISNWTDFIPFGFDNVVMGASILFFAFTGFSNIAASAEECRNPKRDITIGIIVSLVLATLIYVLIGGLVTGIINFSELNNQHPLAHALAINDSNIGSAIVATGAICGMTTVIMISLYGISRIFYVIARDGLLPKFLAKLHPKHDSPYVTIGIFSTISALLGSLCPFEILGQLSSMGALIDYIVIVIIVMLFRFKLPNVSRSFTCPVVFIVAPAAFLASMYLLFKQFIDNSGNLSTPGKMIVYWLVVVFMLYVVRSIFIKNKI